MGAVIGILCEVLAQKTKGKFPLSGVGLGLAFVLRFPDALSMSMGTFFFWYFRRRYRDTSSLGYRVLVDNQETLCAGIIAGGSIIGMILILFETIVLK